MNPKCRTQLGALKGKPLTDAQAQAIDDRMRATMRWMARSDPNWQALSSDDRLLAAGQQAMADIQAEAARKVANAQRQALAQAATESRVKGVMTRQKDYSRARALNADLQRTHAYVDGIKRDNLRHLFDLIEAADSRDGATVGRQALMTLFDAQNPAMTRDIALEVFAQGKAGTGNAAAKKGAEAWLQVTEAMRQRFNAAGGDVGKLDYGYLPQAHDQLRVLKAKPDAWANDVLPLVDRSRYVDDAGAMLSDAEVLTILRGAWETIATDGANKTQPGEFRGTGARANRGSESRQIHFKDGEAYLAYQQKYGTGSMYDAMIGHVGGLAKDIGLVERYGPNPNANMRVQLDMVSRADGPTPGFGQGIAKNLTGPEAQWAVLSGTSGTPAHARVALVAQHVRNVETFGKLQGAVLSSITDTGTYFATVGYNKMPYFEALGNLAKAATKADKDFLNAHGLIADSMISDLNRWAGENVAQSWSGRIANATMRLSLMNAWTDTMRRGFQMTMMQAMGRMQKTDWGSLKEWDRYRMESMGLTADDWGVIQRAQAVQHRGADMVTPDAIYATGDPRASEVAAKFIGMIADESEVAVINPDLTTRALATFGGSQAGTTGGEIARAVAQFKSFPVAMISRHWFRVIDTPQGMEGAPMMANRLAYASALMVSLTALGAIAFQSKQIVSGKDPVDMTTPKFWYQASMQGGGLGFIGEFLGRDSTEDRSPLDSFGRLLLGPTFGSMADAYELTKGNIDEALAGKDTHIGAESLRFARGHLPFVSLWYAKTALDQAGLHALQESASPGYLSRIKNRQKKEWGGDWWAPPGASFDELRAPNMGAAIGQ
jgi:hypothetical protein